MLRGMRSLAPIVLLLPAIILSGCATTSAPEKKASTTTAPPPSTIKNVFASRASATAATRIAYEKYLRVASQVAADGGAHPERYKTVVTSQHYKAEQQSAAAIAKSGRHITGRTTLKAFRLQSVDLETGVTSAYACVDLSGVQVFDKKGTLLALNRPTHQTSLARFRVVQGTVLLTNNGTWSGRSIC